MLTSATLHLDILPNAQRQLWNELRCIPEHFILYGGTALALRLGHRESIDLDELPDLSRVIAPGQQP